MNDSVNNAPNAFLYTMIRVRDLERSLQFYLGALGMKELRRENFTQGRFTLVFIGYEGSPALLELTYNWGQKYYSHGSGYGHVALAVEDVYTTCDSLRNAGVRVIREPGPMQHATDENGHREVIAFIEDPDGYKIELVQCR